jgi:ParB family chromosome partitioning protein
MSCVVTEAVSPSNADLMRNLKKDQLVRKADEELSGLRWLPDNLKAKAANTGEQVD